ncbi:MAG TPA: hypothetical protein VF601_06295 [Beijerinckiaceae bacterium]|jgi:hypothetical protein
MPDISTAVVIPVLMVIGTCISILIATLTFRRATSYVNLRPDIRIEMGYFDPQTRTGAYTRIFITLEIANRGKDPVTIRDAYIIAKRKCFKGQKSEVRIFQFKSTLEFPFVLSPGHITDLQSWELGFALSDFDKKANLGEYRLSAVIQHSQSDKPAKRDLSRQSRELQAHLDRRKPKKTEGQ